MLVASLASSMHRWSKATGFVKPSDGSKACFLHASSVVCGTVAVGTVVSFRTKPSKKGEGFRDAYDVVVLQPGEVVGRVTEWSQQHNGSYSGTFATSGGDIVHFTQQDVPTGTAASIQINTEAVMTSVEGVARNIRLLPTRRGERTKPAAAVVHQHPPLMRRFTGVVDTWSKGKRGEMCGFVKPSDGSMSLFLHTRDVKCGTAAVGKVVSYRAEPSPKGEGYRNAYDVVVLQPEIGEVVGYVTMWQEDKSGRLCGFLKVKAAG